MPEHYMLFSYNIYESVYESNELDDRTIVYCSKDCIAHFDFALNFLYNMGSTV